MYQRVKDGVFYNQKMGRIVEHKGYSTRIFWNKQMLDYLQKNYARMLNEDLADYLGVSTRTMIRKALELRLRKDPEWLQGIYEQRIKMACMISRRKGYPGCFKKGQHVSPETEFKKGHQASPEIKARQSEGMKLWYRSHPVEAKEKARKAGETRRKNKATHEF